MFHKLPTIINNYIFDDYLNLQIYWKQLFTFSIIPFLSAKKLHTEQLTKVLFELKTYNLKKKLESYSVSGTLFKYNKKPCRFNVDNNQLWQILYSGYRYTKNKQIKITLLFEKRFDIYNEHISFFVEASNVFPLILFNDYGYEIDLGRESIEDYDKFINKFMNSIFL